MSHRRRGKKVGKNGGSGAVGDQRHAESHMKWNRRGRERYIQRKSDFKVYLNGRSPKT
jgi:hypothetical protein